MRLCIKRSDVQEVAKVKGEALIAEVETLRRILCKGL